MNNRRQSRGSMRREEGKYLSGNDPKSTLESVGRSQLQYKSRNV
jgi:hypothetical protein